MKKPKNIIFMGEVAKDIQAVNYKLSSKSVRKQFYDVMKKHDIRQGTKTKGGGISCNVPEWTMCTALFLDSWESSITIEMMFNDSDSMTHY